MKTDPPPSRSARPRPPLRTAIIGYGISGRLSHGYGITANKSFELAAICDLSGDNRRRAREEHGCPVYEHYEDMFSREQLDLASVVTRSDTHCRITCDCLQAGLHTVVTKPWALNAGEAEQILAARATSHKELFPWIPMYWAPAYRKIKQLMQARAVGDVFLIRRSYSEFNLRRDWQTETRFGGGYLLNWGMHILQPLIGLAESPVKRVFGQMLQTINPGDADDNFLAVLEFENGIRGIAEYTQSLHNFPSFVIQGTRGTIVARGNEVTIRKKSPEDDAEPETRTMELEGKVFGDEADIYRDIAASLNEGKPYLAPPETALHGTKVLDAVRASHLQRKTVELV